MTELVNAVPLSLTQSHGLLRRVTQAKPLYFQGVIRWPGPRGWGGRIPSMVSDKSLKSAGSFPSKKVCAQPCVTVKPPNVEHVFAPPIGDRFRAGAQCSRVRPRP